MNNNEISNQKNKKFSKVQEGLKRLLSIITCSVEEPLEDFDAIISNSDDPETIKTAEFLKQDDLDRENRIKQQQSEKTKKATEKLANKTISVQQPREKKLSNEQVQKVEKIIERNAYLDKLIARYYAENLKTEENS